MHRDLKPANILIIGKGPECGRVKIGMCMFSCMREASVCCVCVCVLEGHGMHVRVYGCMYNVCCELPIYSLTMIQLTLA